MAEDVRLTVRLDTDDQAAALLRALHAHSGGATLRAELGGRVAASGSGKLVYLYTDSEASARSAQRVVSELAARDGVQPSFTLERWHHAEEEWEEISEAAAAGAAAPAQEHERLEEQEAADARASGLATWELRIEFSSHRDALAFAERLTREGFTHLVRRWRFLIVGTADEDDAEAWAKRLTAELPPGATVHVEPGAGLAWEFLPQNPFAVFGGLGQ